MTKSQDKNGAEQIIDDPHPLPIPHPLPEHIALIMDGNGRWAKERGAPREEGHRVGSEVVNQIVRTCRRWGVKYLTLYLLVRTTCKTWTRCMVMYGCLSPARMP